MKSKKVDMYDEANKIQAKIQLAKKEDEKFVLHLTLEELCVMWAAIIHFKIDTEGEKISLCNEFSRGERRFVSWD